MREWHAFWRRKGAANRMLLPAAWIFGMLSGWRRWFLQHFAQEKLPVPVVVAGSITAGGAGKTPLSEALTTGLRARGRKPGLVLRGYGGRNGAPRMVTAEDNPAICGDEAVLLAERTGTPVAIGADRPAAARLLLRTHPEIDVLVSDDGLQHYRMARDVEIAALSDSRLGNGWLMPAGPLREPPGRLQECHAVVVKDTAPQPGEYSLRMVPAGLRPVGGGVAINGAVLAGRTIAAVAGIAEPNGFFRTLEQFGLRLRYRLAFPDHHKFSYAEIAEVPGDIVVMTGKDAVKCSKFKDPRLYELLAVPTIDASLLDLVTDLIDASETA